MDRARHRAGPLVMTAGPCQWLWEGGRRDAAVNQGDRTHLYSSAGLGPGRHPVEEAPRRSSWRGSLILVAVMFGWMVVVFAGGRCVACRNDPNVEVPVEVGLGVVVTPADGWYSAADVWDVGANAVSLQEGGGRGGVLGGRLRGSNEDLLACQAGRARGGSSTRSAICRPRRVTVAGDLPALMVLFSGTADSGPGGGRAGGRHPRRDRCGHAGRRAGRTAGPGAGRPRRHARRRMRDAAVRTLRPEAARLLALSGCCWPACVLVVGVEQVAYLARYPGAWFLSIAAPGGHRHTRGRDHLPVRPVRAGAGIADRRGA